MSIDIPLGGIERLVVEAPNEWREVRDLPTDTDGVVRTGGRRRGTTTMTVALGRESPFARDSIVRITLDGAELVARVAEVNGSTLTLYDVPDRPWRERILASIPAPQRITAAALRERGLREGWLAAPTRQPAPTVK